MLNALKAKHWQIFSFAVFLPLLVILISFIFIYGINRGNSDIDNMMIGVSFFIMQYLLIFLYSTITLAWAVLIFFYLPLNRILEFDLPPFLKWILAAFPILNVLLLLFSALAAIGAIFGIQIGILFFAAMAFSPKFLFLLFIVKIITSLLAGAALKTFELKRPPRLEEFIGEAVLIWFFVIGVWLIQPRLNAIFDSEE